MASRNEKRLKVHYDADMDALSVVIRHGSEEEFKEIAPGVSVEFDKKKQVIGFEILNASRHFRTMLPQMAQFLQSARKMRAVS